MSVIAWDGNCLAADRMASVGNLKRATTKIFKVNGCLIGATGDSSFGNQMIEWFRNGEIVADFPTSQRDKDDWSGLLVIRPDKTIQVFERTPYPVKYDEKIIAAGSGRDYAMAAMYLGKSAVEAVDVASLFDNCCGLGVTDLYFGVNEIIPF